CGVLAGAAHLPPAEQPEATARRLADFLHSLRGVDAQEAGHE
ncbi:MAG: 3-oxoadipate enol-lactonase, partial [Terrabacter sp.]|nr:3-oxoadipate enol-lactonase [Terrabacter sp.]